MEDTFLASLEDLSGRVILVTGGAGAIGLETTWYLAAKGARVITASRSREKSEPLLAGVTDRLQAIGSSGSVSFLPLDLSSVKSVQDFVADFKTRENRLDAIVANGAIAFAWKDELSPDGWEKTFATNHLGHFVLITGLLDLLEKTAAEHGQARIVNVSSRGYYNGHKLDYEKLQTRDEKDGSGGVMDIFKAFGRYNDSKLANVLFATLLAQKLREKGVKNVYCNSCHPGIVTGNDMGIAAVHRVLSREWCDFLISMLTRVSNTAADGAKTPAYLAAGKEIPQKDANGQFWHPTWTWTWQYIRSAPEKLTKLAQDSEQQRNLWVYSREAVQTAMGA